MKAVRNIWFRTYTGAAAAFIVLIACAVVAAPTKLISARHNSLAAPAGGDGDSGSAIITPDGRYVLFASAADNLETNALYSTSGLVPRRLNVFLRDRLSGVTTLVSVHNSGSAGGSGDSWPTGISTNGRYALFESTANDLVADDTNNATDVFLRDIIGATTTLVSANVAGRVGNDASRSSTMTPDGRYVAFASAASDLVAFDTNRIPDIFVRNLQTSTTTLASLGAQATSSSLAAAGSESPIITADGRYVAFYSGATNLLPGIATTGEIYLRDLVSATTTWVSTNARSALLAVTGSSNAVSFNYSISADGAYVAFESSTNRTTPTVRNGIILRHTVQTGFTQIVHSNAFAAATAFENIRSLDMTPDGRLITFVGNARGLSGTNTAIYVWDAQTGSNSLVSADLSGGVPLGVCESPVLSDDGKYVAFLSTSTNLTANSLMGKAHVYLRTLQAGTTALVDVDTNGVGSGVNSGTLPGIASNGSLIVFDSADGNLVPGDNNHNYDVFVRNWTSNSTELISVHHPDRPSKTPSGLSLHFSSSVSTNGRYVAFASDADNIVIGDTNGCRDVFIRDLVLGTNLLVSASTNNFPGSGISSEPSISADGRYVAFSSSANDLVPGDNNKAQDVFVRDMQAGTNVLISVSTSGVIGNGDSSSPTISALGRYVLFRSKAANLAGGSFSGENLFFRDRTTGVTYALTTTGFSSSSMTPDGRYVAFVANSFGPLFVWDSQSAAIIYSDSSGSPTGVSISPDGLRLAVTAGTLPKLNGVDVVTHNSVVISSGSFQHRPGIQFSGDGRFLAYATTASNFSSDTNATRDVYLYDFQTGTNLLVSRSYASPAAPNGPSDSPAISADGRFVAYRGYASNSVPFDANNVSDLLLFDRIANGTILVSANQSATATCNNASLNPVFSGDGQTLVFQSWGSDLLDHDFNQAGDLFAVDLSPSTITDSDGDGMDDQWEIDHFGDLARDGTGDFDGDGAADLFEFQSGTDPTDGHSIFRASILMGAGSSQYPTIIWPFAENRSYRVQFKNDLSVTNWQDLIGNLTLAGHSGYATDFAPATGQRFYRIRIEP